jgi:hypothetical protein
MLEPTIRRFKRDKQGISNVIVIMLSLVLIAMIVGNVILWSYDMNQLDWEKMQEKITLVNVSVLANGLQVELRNSSPLTAHVIAIWAANETSHQRFETNLYINSGEEISYVKAVDELPEGNLSFKAVTERGNMAVFP